MITPEEFLKINNEDKQPNYKLATVDPAYTSGVVRLIFDGEDTVSQKGYMFLSSYKPAAGDRVLLARVSDTYVIMDKVVSTVSSSASFTDVTVSNKTTTKDISVTGAATLKALNATGAVDFDSTLNVDGTATFNSDVALEGSKLGFYGTTPIYKQTAYKPSSSADLNAVRTRLNELIDKLDNYGLLNSSW